MREGRQAWGWAGVLLALSVALTGCTYAAIQNLSREEQAEYYLYRKVMTAVQEQAYLARASAAERTAYLGASGLTQRFQALDPQDRATVLGGFPRAGMSAEALLFLWGSPYYTAGDARHYAHWFYLGSSFSLAASGNQYNDPGSRVDVYLVEGRVVGWVDYVPSGPSRGRRIL